MSEFSFWNLAPVHRLLPYSFPRLTVGSRYDGGSHEERKRGRELESTASAAPLTNTLLRNLPEQIDGKS
jgi:hypothetical protein